MAANVTSMSLSFAATTPSLLGVVSSSSKRLLPFSALPYPSFSLRTSNPNRAIVDGQTAIVQEQPNDVVFAPEEEEQQPRKLRNATQLYVCNLPRTYDTQQLFDLFSPHGTVLSAQVYLLLCLIELLLTNLQFYTYPSHLKLLQHTSRFPIYSYYYIYI
jgi:RNA recognition motif-containing protein